MPKKQRKQLYLEATARRIRKHRLMNARRLEQSKKLFGRRVYAVDIHNHSNFSDGVGTPADNYEHGKEAGLDFIFVTDHRRIAQRRVLRRWPDASWGQEPGVGSHHVGLLCNERIFKAGHGSFGEKFGRAGKKAPFTWIPHPIGWFPERWYTDEKIAELWEAGNAFAMEIMNGAAKMVRAYDQFDAKAVVTWDRLLCDGRKVTALGGSDAHCPDQMGTVWTGVFAGTRSARSIIKALNLGHCFASEATLLDFSGDGKPMGATLRKRKGSKVRLRFRAADSVGLALIRVICQGKPIKEIKLQGRSLAEGTLETSVGNRTGYFRLETVASDDLRAFSTPIYVERSS